MNLNYNKYPREMSSNLIAAWMCCLICDCNAGLFDGSLYQKRFMLLTNSAIALTFVCCLIPLDTMAQLTKPEPPAPPAAPKTAGISQAEALKLILRKTREDTDSGVIINQLVTVAGQDFYQYFLNAWRDKEGSEHFTLVVRERPSARWGSEVRVEYGQMQVYRTRLPVSRAAIRQLSEDAAEFSYQAVQQAEERRRITQDADIGSDEF